MDFGWAIERLKEGKRVTRSGWNGKGMWLCLQRPDENSKMTLPYIHIKTAKGYFVPWSPSHMDVLGIDWDLVDIDKNQRG